MGGFKRSMTTGEWVRKRLLEVGEDYPHHMYTEYKAWQIRVSRKEKPKTASYQSFRNIVWQLKKLGLITPTRKEKGKGISRRQYYAISGSLNHPGWRDPRKVLWGPRT